MQKKRGSAIVIALLLITAIGAIGFSFGRVLFLDIANASLYENGIGAYYAAESGLEEGFVRYRYQMSAAVPFENWIPDENKVFRYNLTSNAQEFNIASDLTEGFLQDGTYLIGDIRNEGQLTAGTQYFDLRMGSKAGTISGDAMSDASVSIDSMTDQNYGLESSYRIARDETKKFDLGNIFASGAEINLFFKPIENIKDTARPTTAPLNEKNCVLIEAKITGQKADGSIEERKGLLNNSSTCDYSSIIVDPSKAIGYDFYAYDDALAPNSIFWTSALKSKITPAILYERAILSLKPIGSDIVYLLQETGGDAATDLLEGGSSEIKATGYYGGISRTLAANIDRRSGSLYDLYDYVIFKN